MAVENWIDALARIWEIEDGKGSLVRSYAIFDRAEFPEAITQYPCAITYPLGVNTSYGAGYGAIDIWRGQTEFHLFPDTKKSNLARVMPFFGRIRNAAAMNFTLGGLVSHFVLQLQGDSIQGPLVLQYGDEAEHHGLIVNWEVKERTSVSVSG
jgi:hypothetical protein